MTEPGYLRVLAQHVSSSLLITVAIVNLTVNSSIEQLAGFCFAGTLCRFLFMFPGNIIAKVIIMSENVGYTAWEYLLRAFSLYFWWYVFVNIALLWIFPVFLYLLKWPDDTLRQDLTVYLQAAAIAHFFLENSKFLKKALQKDPSVQFGAVAIGFSGAAIYCYATKDNTTMDLTTKSWNAISCSAGLELIYQMAATWSNRYTLGFRSGVQIRYYSESMDRKFPQSQNPNSRMTLDQNTLQPASAHNLTPRMRTYETTPANQKLSQEEIDNRGLNSPKPFEQSQKGSDFLFCADPSPTSSSYSPIHFPKQGETTPPIKRADTVTQHLPWMLKEYCFVPIPLFGLKKFSDDVVILLQLFTKSSAEIAAYVSRWTVIDLCVLRSVFQPMIQERASAAFLGHFANLVILFLASDPPTHEEDDLESLRDTLLAERLPPFRRRILPDTDGHLLTANASTWVLSCLLLVSCFSNQLANSMCPFAPENAALLLPMVCALLGSTLMAFGYDMNKRGKCYDLPPFIAFQTYMWCWSDSINSFWSSGVLFQFCSCVIFSTM